MKTLCCFELKKIMRKRLNVIVMILGIALELFISVGRIYGTHEKDYEQKCYLQGKRAIDYSMNYNNSLTDVLTDNYITQFLKDYQNQVENSFEDSGSFDLFLKNLALMEVIGSTFSLQNGSWSPSTILDIDTSLKLDFYKSRQEKVAYFLNEGNKYGPMTEIEKTYWTKMSDQVTTPFSWGGMKVCDIIWDDVSDLFYLLFILVICLAPVFSGEYLNRTDAVLLTTKYGKNRLIRAKIYASFLFTCMYMGITSALSVGGTILYLGTQGKHLPVQIWSVTSPYNWTIWKAIWLNFSAVLLIALAVTAFTLLLSSRLKTSLATLAVTMVLLACTGYIPYSKSSRFLNKILLLLPEKCCSFKVVLNRFIGYQFGNQIVPYAAMIFVVYGTVIVFCLALTGNGFRKHQVGSRH